MVLLLQICKLRCWLDRSFPLDILVFFLQLHFGFGHVVSIWLFYYVPWRFWDIVHATVADFNSISVENFVKLMASWEMFCYQLKECLCNVCWNGFAKGWVKPYYVFLSRFWFFCVILVFQVSFCRFSVTSKKSTSLRFVWISILKPMSLKMMVFLFFSICWPFRFLKRMRQSSQYNPKLVLGSIFSRFDWI